MKKYSLTEEHRKQLKPWADKWIANAMSTKEMDEEEREIVRAAINGLYDTARLPRPKHIVFVPSPLVLALAGSFSAGIWWLNKNGWNLPSGDVASDAAYDAAYAAIRAATEAATNDATNDATRVATEAAIRAAIRAATNDATNDAIRAATNDAIRAAIRAATSLRNKRYLSEYTKFLLLCTEKYLNIWNGGNQWSGWTSYLSFFKDIVKLDLKEYAVYKHYEACALHSGPRMMHSDFCVVSDRPEVLKVDENNRPHCDDGPSHRWRDGWCLYYWHGVKVDRKVIEEPENITLDSIDSEVNAEVRRIKILRRGVSWYLKETQAKLVDMDSRNCVGGATRALFKDKNDECWLCGTDGSTKRVYYMPVDSSVVSCVGAHESICGFGEGSIVAES